MTTASAALKNGMWCEEERKREPKHLKSRKSVTNIDETKSCFIGKFT